MIHNKQYNITLEEAKLLNMDYKLPLDFSSTITDPIKMNNSLWIGALRDKSFDINKFNRYIEELSMIIKNKGILSNIIVVDEAFNIWFSI